MTHPSAPDSSTDWRTAFFDTWISTDRKHSFSARPGSRKPSSLGFLLVFLVLVPACAYLNTFYNAERAYEEGVLLRGNAPEDSLPPPAREAFERALEKSAIVLDRHGDSKYADDALLLLGHSLYALGRYEDAVSSYRRYLTRFPSEPGVGPARLGLVRAHRRLGNLRAAESALARLMEVDAEAVDEAEIMYEKARIELGLGAHKEAVQTFRALLESDSEFAREHGLILQFADAEVGAGEYEAALEAYDAYEAAADDPRAERLAALRIAAALSLAGRREEALETYSRVLEAGAPDSISAEVEAARGDLFLEEGDAEAAMNAYQRAAELYPGSEVASRATFRRGRFVWLEEQRRDAALDILLDAFLHAPASAHGDSARTAARQVARLLHYERLASGEDAAVGIDDPRLARSTALYRLAEEVLEVESDPARAAQLFLDLAETYPDSPWRRRALLASGLLSMRTDAPGTGARLLREVVETYPDTPEADSARRQLGFEIPERQADFYVPPADLGTLSGALPDPADPMVAIADQMDRYTRREVDRRPTREVERRGVVRELPTPGDERQPDDPQTGAPGAQQPGEEPPGISLPENVPE